ncbi:MAG: DUF2157 domain-containing protein [Zoogloeaceae bacterium]|nr:DUF2157 domain-containing protein [Zoogloeaceae bacterium]
MPQLERHHLDEAAQAGLISGAQASALWSFLCEHAPAPVAGHATFSLSNVLHYLGGMLAIGAMSIFMTLGWEQFGGAGVFFIALLYFAIAWKLATRLEAQRQAIPSGIMATFALVLVPLAVWGLQQALGLWAEGLHTEHYREYHSFIDWRWTTLELATLAAGALMLWRWRAPFLLMPIALTLWYMSMDLAMLLIEPGAAARWSEAAWTFRKWFSVCFGAVMLLLTLLAELRRRSARDYAFWLYLFGLMAFWGGLTSLDSGSLGGKLVYLAINLALVLGGAVLGRRTFTVFGAIGVAIVLGDLSYYYFRDSWLFPIALSAIGLAIVYLGIWWNRNEARIAASLHAILPARLRKLLP